MGNDTDSQNLTVPELKRLCANSFAAFCAYVQGPNYFDPKHADLCHFIQNQIEEKVYSEQDVELMVVMARGSFKTTIVTKLLSVWLTIPSERYSWKGPELRILIATNTLPNARNKLQGIKGYYTSEPKVSFLWPELANTTGTWGSEAATLNRDTVWDEPTFDAAGTKSQKTGMHYNVIIEDDTTAPEKSDMGSEIIAPSRDLIEQGIGWHRASLSLLVPRPKQDPLAGVRMRIVVSTRWADYDLISYLEDKEDFVKYDLPALDDKGEPVMKIMYSKEELAHIERRYGPYMFSCLYLNRPLDQSHRTFKDAWFDWVDKGAILEKLDTGFNTIAIDPAISEKDSACETAITKVHHYYDETSGRQAYQYWLQDVHKHMNPMETAKMALSMVDSQTKAIIVETNAYQAALKYILWDEMTKRRMRVHIIDVQSRTKKEIRIFAMEPYFASGRIFLVRGLSPQVESQLKQFPNGRLVDVIDSFAMHMEMYRGDKAAPQHVEAKRVDDTTWDSVLDEIISNKRLYGVNRGLKTGLDGESKLFGNLSTGLGSKTDLGVSLGVN